ncbi:hypothetical protein [Candidatus Lokiarchaeum ossiferum]|uniref:hypothetical protein n=1 Tax=Candidatus Lokiarchaeum ossiferum TaxID=2951803 RepID=UPI00352E690B
MENIVDVEKFIQQLNVRKCDGWWENDSEKRGWGLPMGIIAETMEKSTRIPSGSWAEKEDQSIYTLMNVALRLANKISNLPAIDLWISRYNSKFPKKEAKISDKKRLEMLDMVRHYSDVQGIIPLENIFGDYIQPILSGSNPFEKKSTLRKFVKKTIEFYKTDRNKYISCEFIPMDLVDELWAEEYPIWKDQQVGK